MTDSNSSWWKRAALISLGAIAIVLSILVLIHPGMTVVSIVYLAGIVLIIVVGAAVIGAVLLFGFVDASVITINAGEVGVLLTFGQADPNPLNPGLTLWFYMLERWT